MNYAEYASKECPVLLVGPPGVGKTDMILSGFDHVKVFLASAMVEEDIAGLPYREGKHEYRTTPESFRKLIEADARGATTCLFFDELDKARRTVADTLLTLVSSRRIGNVSLPENTCIMAAANPPEFGGGDGVSEAMLSRFSVISVVPNALDWAEWATKRVSSRCQRIVEAVKGGIIPLIDRVGDGLDARLCNPRTLYRALLVLESEKTASVKEELVRGLLPPGVATQMLMLWEDAPRDLMTKASGLALRAISAIGSKTRTPLHKEL